MIATLVAVAVLAAVTTVVLRAFRVPRHWAPALAILRGAVQLALLSLVLAGIIASPVWVGVALVLMFAVASGVAARRIGWSGRSILVMSSSMAAGVAVAGTTVFGLGALDLTPRYALALGSIVIGNAMSISTLAGRRFVAAVDSGWDEVEGWLALGARPRAATLAQARLAVLEALVPTTDQTKTTGLVVLPGAFVGAVFGGLSPLEAGRFQILVLAAILTAGAISAVLVACWLGPVRTRPSPPD
nr:ABC transporter permease [Agromyces seonyuensis]